MRTFQEFLSEIRQGDAQIELSEALQTLANKVQDTGRGGSITFTVSLKPSGNGRVMVSDRISTKAPEETHEDTLFFLTESGDLSRRDPRQLAMEELRK